MKNSREVKAVNKNSVSEEESVVHVKMDKPYSFRRDTLSLAVDVAKLIDHSRGMNVLRNTEFALIEELGEIIKEVKTLSKSLESYDLPSLPEEHAKGVHVEEAKEEHREVHEFSDIDRLKAELAAIESKLKDL